MKACRLRALERAKRYVGVRENPAGSNSDRGRGVRGSGPNIDRWCRWANGLVGYPWCAAFACGMIREACGLVVPEPRRASVGFLEAWAADVGSLLKPGTRPRTGDWIIYRFDSDDWPDHIGLVDRVFVISWRGRFAIGRVRTIEGNTSAGDDANGGQVQVRWRKISRAKFVRINALKLRRAK